ncbi:MAG: zf-HC2 domain-containing protein [Planctomycetota bacterium]|nr:zf-HC2 domain-containing protein [Planctomycetota bacterium]
MTDEKSVSLFSLNCREASRLLSEAMERDLTSRERWALWIHTRLCGFCRRFSHQMDLIRRLVHKLPESTRQKSFTEAITLSAERRTQIKKLLSEASESGH